MTIEFNIEIYEKKTIFILVALAPWYGLGGRAQSVVHCHHPNQEWQSPLSQQGDLDIYQKRKSVVDL